MDEVHVARSHFGRRRQALHGDIGDPDITSLPLDVSYLLGPSTGLAACLRAPSSAFPVPLLLFHCCFDPPTLPGGGDLTPSMVAADMSVQRRQ